MLAVLVNPHGYLAELIQLRLTKPVPALLFNRNQPTINQDLNMQRYCLPGYIKFLGYSIYVMRFGGNHINDRPAGRVGYSLVNVSSRFHIMQVSACKYICKYLLAQVFLKLFFGLNYWGDFLSSGGLLILIYTGNLIVKLIIKGCLPVRYQDPFKN